MCYTVMIWELRDSLDSTPLATRTTFDQHSEQKGLEPISPFITNQSTHGINVCNNECIRFVNGYWIRDRDDAIVIWLYSDLRITRNSRVNWWQPEPMPAVAQDVPWLSQEAALRSPYIKRDFTKEKEKHCKEKSNMGEERTYSSYLTKVVQNGLTRTKKPGLTSNLKNKIFSFKYSPATVIPYHLFQSHNKVSETCIASTFRFHLSWENSIQRFLCIDCTNCMS